MFLQEMNPITELDKIDWMLEWVRLESPPIRVPHPVTFLAFKLRGNRNYSQAELELVFEAIEMGLLKEVQPWWRPRVDRSKSDPKSLDNEIRLTPAGHRWVSSWRSHEAGLDRSENSTSLVSGASTGTSE